MPTLTATKFTTPEGADVALEKLQKLQAQQLITVLDAAVVSWEVGKKKPKTRDLSSMTGRGALGGAFWGMLFGLIFFVPFLGAAIGAGIGALTGSLSDAGISNDFIQSVRDKVTPGTSALFLLSSDAVLDRVRDEFRGTEMEIISTNLSNEQEQQLHEAFDND
jgi:uncharacterized membrane protein